MAKLGKTKTHKAQHFVPQCYLKPWLDPDVKESGTTTPYVWLFDADGTGGRRKAPSNIFTENDLYTVELPDGSRSLRLENGLQELEDKYTRIRNRTFGRMVWPDADQMAWLLAFVAAAQFRTVGMRDHWQKQWGRLRQLSEEMQERIDRATPEERRKIAGMAMPPSEGQGRGIDLEELRHLERQPLQAMFRQVLNTIYPMLARMSVAVLCTDDPLGFVTTDNPCMLFDPNAHRYPPWARGPGLGTRSVEFTMPLSPSQCLCITHRPDLVKFKAAPIQAVTELNRLRIAHCDKNFVVRRNEVRPEWFKHPPLPEDAWERRGEAAAAQSTGQRTPSEDAPQ